MILPPEQTSLSAAGVGVAGGADGSIPTVMEEGDKVELANALFGKTSSSSTSSSMTAAATKGNDKGLLGKYVMLVVNMHLRRPLRHIYITLG